MKSGDETDEAEAHDEDDGGGNLQARGIIGIKSEHVGRAGASDGGGAVSAGSSAKAAAAHAGGCGGGATWRGDAGT